MDEGYALDVDDYAGMRVVLRESVWRGHILKEHPELTGALRGARAAVSHPSFVYQDRRFPTAHLYYRLGAVPRFRHLYLVVVIRFDWHPAEVRTMYLAKEPRGTSGRLVYASAPNRD